MKKFYLLHHYYDCGPEDDFYECRKNLGLYETEELAKKALRRYRKLEGFKDFNKNTFIIEEYVLNKDMYWEEGFIDWSDEKYWVKGYFDWNVEED